jgi:hypothetical protein
MKKKSLKKIPELIEKKITSEFLQKSQKTPNKDKTLN